MLVKAGLVEQHRSPTERRADELYITEEGRVEARVVRELVKSQSKDFFAGMDAADQAHLMRILSGLYRDCRKDPS